MESHISESQTLAVGGDRQEEIRHVPLWVKVMVAIGLLLFLIQIPDFTNSLSDAIEKSRAAAAYDKRFYFQSVEKYQELHARYPADTKLTKKLGFAHYRAGQYIEALNTFDQLVGVKMTKDEVADINAAVADIVARLNLKTNQVD
jgi:tetratricopeptide (TPR) repeat protein